MTRLPPRIEPAEVIQLVEEFVTDALTSAEKYTNSTPLDESGVWSLHSVAAKIYAIGYDDGERAEGERSRRQQQREREACRTIRSE